MTNNHKKEKTVEGLVARQLKRMKIMFRFDVGAGIKLTKAQGLYNRDVLHHKRGYPDLFISEPRGDYHGLFVELKRNSSEIARKTKHNQEQQAYHEKLRDKGYCVVYGLGFDDAMRKINEYLEC